MFALDASQNRQKNVCAMRSDNNKQLKMKHSSRSASAKARSADSGKKDEKIEIPALSPERQTIQKKRDNALI